MEIKRFKNYCLIKDICTEELLLCFISLLLLSPSFLLARWGGGGGEGRGWWVGGEAGQSDGFLFTCFFLFHFEII